MVSLPVKSQLPRRLQITVASVGRAQLSLVEHALCPIDANATLAGPLIHESRYWFSDKNRHRKEARVRIACPDGLSPTDEFYLWGLLSLTFAQAQPAADFYATPYYCLRQLGCIDRHENRSGSKNYTLFRAAVSRLSTVSYRNDHFYDPIRAEHRDVGFGFLSYSLPLDPGSSRAWRIAWDPIFFELCQAVAGSLRFDFSTYRDLDPACRRLYLILKKIFWRSDTSPEFNLRDLATNIIGFSATQETWKLKQKVIRCLEVLLSREIIRLPEGVFTPAMVFTERARGQYSLRLHRGPRFDAASPASFPHLAESPLYEPLKTIGLDDATIGRLLRTYDPRLVAECADMTLAAKEHFKESYFKASPAAYFIDNLKAQAGKTRTPPDWWRELRKEEERRKWRADHPDQPSRDGFEAAFDVYLKTEARQAFGQVMDRIFQDLASHGQSEPEARNNARDYARTHFVGRFRAEHPEWNTDGPVRAGDIFHTR